MNIRQRLGSNLRKRRLEMSWSQEELAEQANIHRTYVSDLERGSRNPTISVLEKLAKALRVNVADLLR